MTDEELYEGFTPEQIERYTREVNERYDPKIVAESNRRVRNMTKAQWQAVKAEGGAVAQQLADLMDKAAERCCRAGRHRAPLCVGG